MLRRDALYRRALAAADIAAAALSLLLALVVIGGEEPASGSLVALPLVVLLGKVVGLYDRDERLLRKTTLEEVPTVLAVATIFVFVTWLSDGVSFNGSFRRSEAVSLWLLLFGAMVSFRGATRSLVRALASPERCLVVGDEQSARAMDRKFRVSFSLKATVVGWIPLKHSADALIGYQGSPLASNGHGPTGRPSGRGPSSRRDWPHESNGRPPVEASNGRHLSEAPTIRSLGSLETLGMVLVEHDIDRVIIVPASAEADQTLQAIRVVKSLGVKVSVLPRMFEVVGSAIEFDDVDGIVLLSLHPSRLTRSSRMIKRGMDIVGSLGVLLVLSPLIGAVALVIKLTSRGPIFFRQKRIGRHGVEFEMLKFRSMRDGADREKCKLLALNETDGLFKIASDPRVTPFGRLLRRCSLDELPQLWNVLRGEMSLVGPRPLVPEDDAKIAGWERERLDLIPGMTGVWQILGSTRVPLEEMVKIDYLYRANWSLWMDMKILLRTALYVVSARSA